MKVTIYVRKLMTTQTKAKSLVLLFIAIFVSRATYHPSVQAQRDLIQSSVYQEMGKSFATAGPFSSLRSKPHITHFAPILKEERHPEARAPRSPFTQISSSLLEPVSPLLMSINGSFHIVPPLFTDSQLHPPA